MSRTAGGSLVVVTSLFPEPNETFIVRELGVLCRRGFALTVLSLRPRPAMVADPEARALLSHVAYPDGAVRVLVAAGGTAVRHPVRTVRLLGRALVDATRAARSPSLAAKQLAIVPIVLGFVRQITADVSRIHAHFASVPTAAARMLAAFTGRPYSFTAHAWDIHVPENKQQLPPRIHDAAFVVTCTGFNWTVLREVAARAEDAAKIHLSHHGLDLAAYVPPTTRHPHLIVGGASLTEIKGLHHLLDACARLRAWGLPFECVLVGQGPERAQLEERVRMHGLGDAVSFTGQLPHQAFLDRLRDATVLAHPSIVDRYGAMDGIPNTILEAMAVETPVVATRLSGIPEVIEHERTGLLVDPHDVEGLAAALARVLRDPELASRLGTAARAVVLERFDLERNVARLVDLFAGEVPSELEAPSTLRRAPSRPARPV